ncbi:Scavenger receptor class A member 5 [Takifugu flavidus]|uniref:Scavenger receptor class A member 5 n=1 Tax=Takifugu flavidus TaxID=433684 RepID=A0A5C6NPL4_9TELE|nr:Scavenger receptor class A member 5 [Takifugu flavidus]
MEGLELELRNLQAHSHQSEGYLVQLDDRLSSLSSSAERNVSSLISEVSRTSTWLHNQDVQLRETSGQLSRLRENLDEVNWTVGAVNHTFSSDISFHRRKIHDMQIQISNITEDTSSLWVTHVHTEAQLRSEMDILNTITEDLRLKDWEHSLALKNITMVEGKQNTLLTSVPINPGKLQLMTFCSVVLWSKRGFIYTCIFSDP